MLELKLFGTGQVRYFDQSLAGFPNQQGCLLLCYLLLNRHRPHNRERLAAVFWAPIARVTYGQAIVLKERDYVEAARVMGGGTATVLLRHILPHLLPVVGAYAALSVGWAVLFESALGFLGAGVQEPEASIGSMLGSYLVYYRSHPGLILFPAIFLGLLDLLFALKEGILSAKMTCQRLCTRVKNAKIS